MLQRLRLTASIAVITILTLGMLLGVLPSLLLGSPAEAAMRATATPYYWPVLTAQALTAVSQPATVTPIRKPRLGEPGAATPTLTSTSTPRPRGKPGNGR